MYDQPKIRQSIHFAAVDFGGGTDVTRVIACPTHPNKQSQATGGIATQNQLGGRVIGALVHNITEVFAGSTLDAGVQVGDGSDADKYFDSGRVLDEEVDTGESVWLEDDGAAVDIETERDSITVTFQVATGTPTGIADVELLIDWY